MPFNSRNIRRLLKAFDFETLFIEELGWNHLHLNPRQVEVSDEAYELRPVAEKKGVQIFTCGPSTNGRMPEYSDRQKIDRRVTKWAREHVIIFVDDAETTQIWQWVKRQQGKPAAYREHTYRTDQSGEALIQKLRTIAFTLEEEEFLLLSDVTYRLEDALDKEQVTKKFYRVFDKERKRFLKTLEGIELEGDREWYTSVMLNRLMFVYFIQKKGFLDGDPDYLRNRLKMCRERFGDDQFYSFYRTFLLRLFHDGLGRREEERAPKLVALLGDIPFLNGGIFQPHELERRYDDLDIPDEAFERVFDFFDDWDWHLDYRPLQDNREINPDVLGYIFEQYVNQKQMGAYYTKEDITGYISRNTVLPFLLEETRKGCKEAFEGDETVWKLLENDPDRYIYPAVQHGADLPLPEEIAAGLDDVSKRDDWNTLAPEWYALPTELWREVATRRRRYKDVRGKLVRGEVRDVNDLITLNLDIEQFAQDVVETCEGPYLLRAFFGALKKVTVLDPTCGSGAFLFAALELLEPLYLACLTRMQAFVEDLERSGEPHHPKKYSDFREVLSEALDEETHPNLDYYVYKSIILNNLYGVDIMDEAVEICKLRLFLKLAAQVDRVEHLEPLPDIDFNIRAGNTLVGYATLEEAQKAIRTSAHGQTKLVFEDELSAEERIRRAAEDASRAAEEFRKQQTTHGGLISLAAKRRLRRQLDDLANELNRYLATEYLPNADNETAYSKWFASHQPFHWFVEFYGIMRDGGFDVVIGNPPYIELRAVTDYEPKGYATTSARNLYALVMERCVEISATSGRLGFIVPVSSVSASRYSSLQNIISAYHGHYASFDDRPSRLFDGLQHIRLTIHLMSKTDSANLSRSTRYNKWYAEERPLLFDTINHTPARSALINKSLPKLSSELETEIIGKLEEQQSSIAAFYGRSGKHVVHYSRKVGYFLQILNFQPLVLNGNGERRPPSEFKTLKFSYLDHAYAALCCLNSSLFYWFTTVFSDCRHLNKREVDAFPVDLDLLADSSLMPALSQLASQLMGDLEKNSDQRTMKFKHDTLTIQCIIPKHSKPIIDKIDRVLAEHYGFTDEELDFIVNYDIKYRMGLDHFEEKDFGETVTTEGA